MARNPATGPGTGNEVIMRETFLERDWRIANNYGPFSITRINNYHPTFGCTFKTPALQLLSDTAVDEQIGITDVSIVEALASMVRDEAGGRQEGAVPVPDNNIEVVTDDLVFDLLAQYETQIAFGERTEAILEDNNLSTPEQKIAALLADPKIGNRRNSDPRTVQEIKRGLDAALSNNSPLVFLLPAFPFKDQNPFRSDLPATIPDLGEIALLIHLHCLAMAMNQVFRHDVLWLIVSDGTVYEEIFGVELGSGRNYVATLADWRTRLNLSSSIHFIDLQDVVSRYDHKFRNQPDRMFSTIENRIRNFFYASTTGAQKEGSAVANNLAELARGMLWNRNSSNNEYEEQELWDVHVKACNKEQLPQPLHALADHLWGEAMETAIQYASFNLASKYTNLLSGFMPYAIRATSHPKPGQVAIPRDTGVSPWNGLALYERRASSAARVRSFPLCQLGTTELMRFRLSSSSLGFGFSTRESLEHYRY